MLKDFARSIYEEADKSPLPGLQLLPRTVRDTKDGCVIRFKLGTSF